MFSKLHHFIVHHKSIQTLLRGIHLFSKHIVSGHKSLHWYINYHASDNVRLSFVFQLAFYLVWCIHSPSQYFPVQLSCSACCIRVGLFVSNVLNFYIMMSRTNSPNVHDVICPLYSPYGDTFWALILMNWCIQNLGIN